jgi:hypothetical protein
MLQPARSITAALVAAALLLGSAGTAGAAVFEDEGLEAAQKETPILLDAFILRPVGLALTAIGTVLFVPAAAVVGATRPVDIGKPFQLLVANPFRYTFIDPLGQHETPGH